MGGSQMRWCDMCCGVIEPCETASKVMPMSFQAVAIDQRDKPAFYREPAGRRDDQGDTVFAASRWSETAG
ncbi:hypothetical protein ASE37_13895 [Rhizobium sp. Root268]|nr:hypothetical protein ASC86_13900 [Rhizobium sp. Root1212]KRD23953.1 hypothetical protein ASE37_13895 [Rhizobium sp. Root268]